MQKVVALLALLLAGGLLGCEPKLVVGQWSCEATDASAGGAGADQAVVPLTIPWSTGFENDFCEYAAPSGFCYAAEAAAYEIVTEPVRSGRQAAAFSLNLGGDVSGDQTRCAREGELPEAAYYGAYFFIPEAPSSAANWNLMHFRSGRGFPSHGLWDVSLDVDADGFLWVTVFDHLRMMRRPGSGVPPVPVGTWVQLEAYFVRAADETGEFAVYQDGELALGLTDLSTDDGAEGQWFVGNLARTLTPAESTIYVDDISMREAP